MTVIKTARTVRLLSIALLGLNLLASNSCTASLQTERDMKTPPPWGICTSVSNAEKMKAAGTVMLKKVSSVF